MVVFEPHNLSIEPISEETRAAFNSPAAPAWCSQVLRDPTLQPIATPSRQPKASTEDSLIAETLAAPNTITAWQSFYREFPPQQNAASASDDEEDGTAAVAGERVSMLALGRGVNGHTDVAHGGLLSAVMDDIMGMVVSMHRSRDMPGYTA